MARCRSRRTPCQQAQGGRKSPGWRRPSGAPCPSGHERPAPLPTDRLRGTGDTSEARGPTRSGAARRGERGELTGTSARAPPARPTDRDRCRMPAFLPAPSGGWGGLSPSAPSTASGYRGEPEVFLFSRLDREARRLGRRRQRDTGAAGRKTMPPEDRLNRGHHAGAPSTPAGGASHGGPRSASAPGYRAQPAATSASTR